MSKIWQDLVGVPFKENGRDLNGLDCFGVPVIIYQRLGKTLPEVDYESVARDVVNGKIEENKDDYIILDKPEPFCMVTFFIKRPDVSHIGVVLEDCNRFIHVTKKSRVVIDRLDSLSWCRRIDKFWRPKI